MTHQLKASFIERIFFDRSESYELHGRSGKLSMQFDHFGHFSHAGCTPISPRIDDHNLVVQCGGLRRRPVQPHGDGVQAGGRVDA